MFDRLSQFWLQVQGVLFPIVEEELGPLTEKQQELVETLEVVQVERLIPSAHGDLGRPKESRAALARAFIAKAVYNMTTTRALIERLQTDKSLRRICGWERKNQIPDESTFSRAFTEFANSELPQRVHNVLIQKAYENGVVGHTSRDSTPIEAREKPVKKEKKEKQPQKRGRPKNGEERPSQEPKRLDKQLNMSQEERLDDLPKFCDVGAKTNSKGHMEWWVGYKFHIDSGDGGVPLSCILTSASLHDSQVAIPLAEETHSKVFSFYDLMDSAYDCPQIIEHSKSLGHVPIIDKNMRRDTEAKKERELESIARKTINWEPAEEIRYNQRTSAERVNSRLKDEFGGRMVRVRGNAKVACHLMFGILALTANALLNLVR